MVDYWNGLFRNSEEAEPETSGPECVLKMQRIYGVFLLG